ncbi:MAG TPA: arabinofuranosidase catalytic domain-containing protein [Pseudonocardiaceae bacterium]|nr:arabinofuranosidase catalytic domain-containing protein [Pseudonocardiaceae bacterium]
MIMRHRWFHGAVHRMLVVAAVALSALVGFGVTAGPAQAATALPCDIYAAGGTPCVTAHSTVRALFATYNGPLYQVQRKSDGTFADIGLTAAGGFANAAAQVSFCSGTSCTITKIYDQTANHNDLPISWGGFWPGPGPNGSDVGANAAALPVTVAGHPAFGVQVTPGVGYRIDNARSVPTGAQPEGIYMVTSSNDVGQFCCFDYGSGETTHTDTGNATMNAIEWGTACWLGGCTGTGPWVEADLENGMYSSNTGPNDASNPGVHFPFVTAIEKNNGTSNFTLKDGNATSGGLTTTWSGPLPSGYSPMKLQPSILLGTGGDNSNSAPGEFFEGAVTAGFPSDATENAVQSNLVATGYSGSSAGSSTGALHAVGAARCLDVPNSSTTPGTQLQIWSCSGAANQTFTHTASNQLTVYNGGDCLDANNNGVTAGTKVIIWPCNGQTNQQWQLNANGTVTGVQSGLCLDVTGAGTANGTLVQLWTCNGGSNQQWTLR